VYMPTSPDASFTQKFQDGGRIPEVVTTLPQITTSRCSRRLRLRLRQRFRARPIHFHKYQHCPIPDNSIRRISEVETVPQTGSTNNLITETDIDAISVDIPTYLGGKFFTGIYASHLKQRFLHPEFPRWWTDTGSSYNFATENDIKALTAAAAMF